jgi:hypothetical protein
MGRELAVFEFRFSKEERGAAFAISAKLEVGYAVEGDILIGSSTLPSDSSPMKSFTFGPSAHATRFTVGLIVLPFEEAVTSEFVD